MLLRLLFPSWAFFDAVTDIPRLEVRGVGGDGQGHFWTPALSAPRRRLWNVLFNPLGTAHLAMQSLVDRLAVEQESGQQDATTIELVTALAQQAIGQPFASTDESEASAALLWQWRVVAVDALCPGVARVIYESAPLENVPLANVP